MQDTKKVTSLKNTKTPYIIPTLKEFLRARLIYQKKLIMVAGS